MTDREQAGLRGNVENCRTEQDYAYPDHHWVAHVTYVFSRAGNLLLRRYQNPDGSEWSERCEYDDAGRIREKHLVDRGSEEITVYRYDAAGRLESAVTRSQGSERVSESVRYADDGSKTETFYPKPLTEEERRTTGVGGAALLYWSADAAAIMTCFDSSGRAVRKVLYDAGDRVIRRIGFGYDEHGRLIEEGELIGKCIREDFRHVYRYDGAGRRVEADMRWGELLAERRSHSYNGHGDPDRERIEQTDLGDGPRSWTECFTYSYDASGNWVERITEEFVPEHAPQTIMIERRSLTYY